MLVGLILAAGSGSRMGGPKAILEIGGIRLVDSAVSKFHTAGINEIYVVLGAWVGQVPGAQILINNEWEEGMGSSLRIGLNAFSEMPEIDCALISLVDLPGMTSAALTLVAQSPASLAMGEFEGRPSHPVKMGREHWSQVIEVAKGDAGARNYLKGRSDIDYIPLDEIAHGKDIDTQEDLTHLRLGK
jgi:nicotine blue oxidoreductase